ncbi:hypothetical protein V8B97DRAFT_1108356 [Scleroderma yunnanense]
MSDYPGLNSIWNITPSPSQFSQLPDDDILALLAKQFPQSVSHELNPSKDTNDANVDPQSINKHPLSGISPPSDDSSPSPSSNHTDPTSRRQSQSTFSRLGDNATHGDEAHLLKRKASDNDLDEGPSSKNMHTADESSNTKKGQPPKRKSTGNPQDESRLLKRKEQNRAAQRAFRERKEKHVKDLEDKLAALEAKNEEAQAENSNLRDLLTRLQQENITLKQSQFTFAVPKTVHQQSPSTTSSSNILHPSSPFSFFNGLGPSSASLGGDIDWGALTTFDPAMLNMLDEPPTTDVTMHQQQPQQHQQTDYSASPFGPYALPPPNQCRTIANNPWLMSFADSPDTPSTTTSTAASTTSPVNMSGTSGLGSFDTFGFGGFGPASSSNSLSWGSSKAPVHSPSTFGQPFTQTSPGLEELFAGAFLTGGASRQNSGGPMDFPAAFLENGVPPLSLSPVSHANGGVANTNSTGKPITPSSPSSTSMHRSNSSSSLKNNAMSSPPTSTSESVDGTCCVAAEAECNGGQKRLTRDELAKHIAASGESPFTSTSPTGVGQGTESVSGMALHKASDFTQGHIIACHGSRIPKTKESPDNIEVLKAWRTITSDPNFKDTDMNELCSEFSMKARCDGTKVVLEPEGVNHIIEKLKKRHAMQNLQAQQELQHLQQLQRQFQGQL